MIRTYLQLLFFVAMCAVVYFSFTTPPPQQQIGEASRIFYYHIPLAWLVVLSYTINVIYAIKYLRSRREIDDFRSLWSAQIGIVFCVLATLSGAFFAKVTWGVYWSWGEPRMLSIFILLLVYGAYLSLRAAMPNQDRKGRLGAVYAILAYPTVPFLVFVMPRIMSSLHPADSVVDSNLKMQMSGTVLILFGAALICFTILYFWIFTLGNRLHRISNSGAEE